MAEVSTMQADSRRGVDGPEAAARELRAGLFAMAGLEHQVKTAVSIIEGWADTLERSWGDMPDDERRHAVSIIKRRASWLHGECDRLMAEAREGVEQLGRQPITADLRALLEPLIMDLDGMNATHSVELHARGRVEATVQVSLLEQVVTHLVENAIKHSREGAIVVRLQPGRRTVDIEVIDDGPGLPDDVEIFAPFQHGDLESDTEGAGLGLYVVSRMVEAMAGTLSASGNASGGATFLVRLPR